MSIRIISETVNADKKTVKKKLYDILNMKKVCAYMQVDISLFQLRK